MILWFVGFSFVIVVASGILDVRNLQEMHASRRSHILNIVRLGSCAGAIGLAGAQIGSWPASIALALLGLGLFVLPGHWLVRLGGRERRWVAHDLYLAAADIKIKANEPLSSEEVARLRANSDEA